ncbi:MAG: PIG-L family deacetylase [Salibacteraceae bacterium]
MGWLLFATLASGQRPHQPAASEIQLKLNKLNVLGNVLYLAAHPDDENTRFIGYCANERLFNTAYLSLTRGDGGQNLIGPEIREGLGIIRTQELLAARRKDGGQQFFSRANDFGYSKTSTETQQIWDKEKILGDMVWVIRNFRPDVIVCRFPPDSRGGHGHHTASAELGLIAFEMAADPEAYPAQLKYTEVWQTTRIVVNTGRWWRKNISADEEGVVAEDIGSYNPLLGTSYNELAARSRSQHKSQGFGATGSRGELIEYFEHIKGKEAQKSLFEGYSGGWERLKGSKDVAAKVKQVIAQYNPENPSGSIDGLLALRAELLQLNDPFWKLKKLQEIDQLILDCAGIYLEAKADDYAATPGDSAKISFEFINRSGASVELKQLSSNVLGIKEAMMLTMDKNQKKTHELALQLPSDLTVTQPYWLAEKGTLGTYRVDNQLLIGKPENDPSIAFQLQLMVNGTTLDYEIPLIYKWNDPVKGELYRPFTITPPVFVNFSERAFLFSSITAREVVEKGKSGQAEFSGTVQLNVPSGWKLSQSQFKVQFERKGEEQLLKVSLQPIEGMPVTNGNLTARVLDQQGDLWQNSLQTIAYDHIPTQSYFPSAATQIVYVDLKKKGRLVGYWEGAGDVIPESLENVGYQVDRLSEGDLSPANLKRYDAIVLGIRALNTDERMDFAMPALLAYAKAGGTLIVQYNTYFRLKTQNYSPFPIKISRDRVTEEDAKVTFLQPDHPVLNQPNKITAADFDGWVQERGLYFPSEWDEKYAALLSWHDVGEDAKEGSLLVAPYGEGYYVYTGISFFRQLPAGVPGAYRLLVNLISLGNEE